MDTPARASFEPKTGEVALGGGAVVAKRTDTQKIRDMALVSDLLLKGWSPERIFLHLAEVADKYGYTYTRGMLNGDIRSIRTGYRARMETNIEQYRSEMVARIHMERAEIWKWIERAEQDQIEISKERKDLVLEAGTDANGKPKKNSEARVAGHTRVSERKRVLRAPVGLFERLADLDKLEVELTGIRKPVDKEDYDEAVWRPGGQKVIPYADTAEMLMQSLGAGQEVVDADFSG
jgi:hypothetical protein